MLPKTLFTFGENVFRFLGSGGLSKAARGIGSRMVSLGKWLTANGKKVIQELFAGGASFNSTVVGAFFNNMVKSAKGAVQKAGTKIADSLLKFFLRPIKKIGSDVGHAIGTVVGAVLFEVVFALITAGIGLGVSAAKGVVKSIAGLLARAGRKIVQVARLVVGKVWNLLSKCGNGLVKFVMKMSPTLGKKFGELVGAVRAFVGTLWKRVQGAKAGVQNLTQQQARAVTKIDNIVNKHLKPHDYTGTIKDMTGNPVPKPGGGYWDHLQEMNNSLRGLRKNAKILQNINNPAAKNAYRKAMESIKKVEQAIKGMGL